MKISTLIEQGDINSFVSIGLSGEEVRFSRSPGNLSSSMGRTITGES